MVNISTTNLLDLVSVCFYPVSGLELSGKLADCYSQFFNYLQNNGLSKDQVVKQTIFMSAQNSPEYFQNKQKLFACARRFFSVLPPTSILAQSPGNESVVLEVTIFQEAKPSEISVRERGDTRWSVFQRGKDKLVFAAGLGLKETSEDLLQQSVNSFELAEAILNEEGMDFSNVIRQWNYIEKITCKINHAGKASQHYQIFNDVRSKYYDNANFSNGYPAATGIGMDFGVVCIDFIAARVSEDGLVVGIKSPVQFDAYTYSKEVLAENCAMSDFCRTTPKFERAKLISMGGSKWIFISGTAAIVGQDSDRDNSVEHQTEMTIDNIKQLISVENITKQGVRIAEEPEVTYLRVYVKYKEDLLAVEQICRKHFKDISLSFVVADICRQELLVEMEGHGILT